MTVLFSKEIQLYQTQTLVKVLENSSRKMFGKLSLGLLALFMRKRRILDFV